MFLKKNNQSQLSSSGWAGSPHTERKLSCNPVDDWGVAHHCIRWRLCLHEERYQVGSIAIDHDQDKKGPAHDKEVARKSAGSRSAAPGEKQERYEEGRNAVVRTAVPVKS